MKKVLMFLCAMLFLFAGASTAALGAPLIGTWNSFTTGVGDDFNGISVVLDPGNDGASIGDEGISRDRLFPLSGDPCWNPYYWKEYGLIRDTSNFGPYIPSLDGTKATREFTTTRSGGTFVIYGENLWGTDHEEYTASLQGETAVTLHYNLMDNQNGGWWSWDHSAGEMHMWGNFNEDPYLLDITADVYISYRGWSDCFSDYIILADLDNVQMQIDPVPEPATMLLLGSGLIGLAGFRRKLRKR